MTAALENSAGTSRNPLLCEQCSPWDDLASTSKESLSMGADTLKFAETDLQWLSKNARCVMCKAISTAVITMISQYVLQRDDPDAKDDEEGGLRTQWKAACQKGLLVEANEPGSDFSTVFDPARIFVRNDGPYFLDAGFGVSESSFDQSLPNGISIDEDEPNVGKLRIILRLTIGGSHERPQVNETVVDFTPQLCLRFNATGSRHLSGVESWEVPHFDIGLLKCWLRGCEESHGSVCSEADLDSGSLPVDFRVIDVRSMNVTKPNSPVSFVALSYMWPAGGDSSDTQLLRSNLTYMESPYGLTDVALPKIIADAIVLCRELGESYLWVDRLCIVQDDAGSKHGQIRAMDIIYNSARLTIVAALDNRVDRGLPGCTDRPRTSSLWTAPRKCEVEGGGIRPEAMNKIVDASLWNKRGWTFQERVLSRRRLYISESQAIFECSLGAAYEELTWSPRVPPSNSDGTESASSQHEAPAERGNVQMEQHSIPGFVKWEQYDSHTNYNVGASMSLTDYFNWVQNYTTRQLSFGSDILNAFAGVGNALGKVFSSKIINGLPEKYLPQALMWQASDFPEKRQDLGRIPTWSWASSEAPCNYYWINGSSTFDRDLIKITSIVIFHYQDPTLGLRKLDVEERWVSKVITLQQLTAEVMLPDFTNTPKYSPGKVRSTHAWLECPHSPWRSVRNQTLDPGAVAVARRHPGALVFNTTVIDAANAPQVHMSSRQDDQPLQAESHKPSSPPKRKLIVLCGSLADWKTRKIMVRYLGIMSGVDPYDHMWRLHVLLVEPDPVELHVVRRVDSGYIDMETLKDCQPQWETVVLC